MSEEKVVMIEIPLNDLSEIRKTYSNSKKDCDGYLLGILNEVIDVIDKLIDKYYVPPKMNVCPLCKGRVVMRQVVNGVYYYPIYENGVIDWGDSHREFDGNISTAFPYCTKCKAIFDNDTDPIDSRILSLKGEEYGEQ